MKMDRREAINYLERHDKIDEPYQTKERKFTKEEEQKINRVMKEGKIFGDPLVLVKGFRK